MMLKAKNKSWFAANVVENGQQLKLVKEKINDDDIPTILNFLEDHPGINSLNLSQNEITDKGVALMTDNAQAREQLRHLDLSCNFLNSTGAKALLKLNLISLNMRCNLIGDEGAQFLSQIRTLKRLDVSNNGISSDGAMYLANTKLTFLNIDKNYIDDKTAIALAANKQLSSLTEVKNNIFANAYCGEILTVKGQHALQETNPTKRINNAINNNLKFDFPSLKRLSCFAVKNNQIDFDKTVIPNELIDFLKRPKI